MNLLIDYILSLFSNEEAAQNFFSGPGQAMTNAGLINVMPDELAAAAASAVPGVPIPDGDPVGGLQQALADLGFDETFRRTWDLYLAFSEGGFAAGYLDVHQFLITR